MLSDLPTANNRCAGFTLVELVVTIGIVGILAAVAIPSFSSAIASTRSKGVATDLYMTLIKARSEAVKRNTSVIVEPSGAGWSKGWKAYPSNATGNILEDHSITGVVTVSGPSSVRYNSSGRTTGAPSFSIEATMGGASSEQCLSISLSGLPSIKSAAC
jgi:type IV fimbrial biogenesis protein FimT